ncbi:MAG: hypothetical protein LBD32_01170 [Cytophagales bacterium]|nr:hypothetical protein [Cytophagales bacterium]
MKDVVLRCLSFLKINCIFISLGLLSCGDGNKNLSETLKGDERGWREDLTEKVSGTFCEKINTALCDRFEASSLEAGSGQTLLDCSHVVEREDRGNSNDIFLLGIVSGLNVRDVDPFSPIVTQVLRDLVRERGGGTVPVETVVLSRWESNVKGATDNETFETQFVLFWIQLKRRVAELERQYGEGHIRIIVVGEGYGGRMTLFIMNRLMGGAGLNQLMRGSGIRSSVFFCGVVFVNSRLYGSELAVCALKSKFLALPPGRRRGFVSVLGRGFDLLEVEGCKNSLLLMSGDSVEGITTVKALNNLQEGGGRIVNLIGTPRRITVGGRDCSFKDVANWISVRCGIRGGKSGDSLLEYLMDGEYLSNSDGLFKTSEMTRDLEVIGGAKDRRSRVLRVYRRERESFVCMSDLVQVGEVTSDNEFYSGMLSEEVRGCFEDLLG